MIEENKMSGTDSKTLAILAIVIAVIGLGYGFISSGPAGPEGPQGPSGPQGIPGETGPAGPGVSVSEITATVETVLEKELSERLQMNIVANIEPRRGCTSCHVLVDAESGKYTLAYEAHERVEARRGTDSHPTVAPDGTDISHTSTAGVETCLLCHASDPETERGVGAPLSLRDIVHPAHMTSQTFKVYYGGNCFTCHNVNAAGEFEVLGVALDINDKGVPNPDSTTLSTGGKLYDKWWKVATDATEPTVDNALWSTQDTNTRSGSTSWRCKECHGWDYKGSEGAYSSGSHYTGFAGVYNAISSSVAEVVAVLKGETNADHDFSAEMNDDDLTLLAEFITQGGVIDVSQHINADKTVNDGDIVNGMALFDATCAVCHGTDGAALGHAIGELSNDNPWETLHKIRFGQPATAMPAAVDNDWSLKDMVDVLAYLQTLG